MRREGRPWAERLVSLTLSAHGYKLHIAPGLLGAWPVPRHHKPLSHNYMTYQTPIQSWALLWVWGHNSKSVHKTADTSCPHGACALTARVGSDGATSRLSPLVLGPRCLLAVRVMPLSHSGLPWACLQTEPRRRVLSGEDTGFPRSFIPGLLVTQGKSCNLSEPPTLPRSVRKHRAHAGRGCALCPGHGGSAPAAIIERTGNRVSATPSTVFSSRGFLLLREELLQAPSRAQRLSSPA